MSQTFHYDPNRRLLLQIENNALEQSYIYDQFGNIITLHNKDISTLETRTKRYLYDRNGLNVMFILFIYEFRRKNLIVFSVFI